MVWAKSRLVIRDYLFEPRRDLYLMWTGKVHPKIYIEIYSLLQDIFAVPKGNIIELLFDWNSQQGKHKFKISWRVIKEFDIYSYLRLDVNFSGKIDEENNASISIALKPRFFTEFPQDNAFQQTIFYEILRRMWCVFFYDKKRQEYMAESRELVLLFHEKVKKLLESYDVLYTKQRVA